MGKFKSKAHVPPIVRPGQKTPFRKATTEEVQRRVEECADLLTNQVRDGQIHRHFRDKYGLHWRTVDDIFLVRARILLRQRANKTAEEARQEGLAIIDQVIRTGTNRERLLAEQRKAEIFGDNAPRRTELSGPQGGPIQPEELSLKLDKLNPEQLDRIIAACEAGGNGRPGRNGDGQAVVEQVQRPA